ncbi:MAG: hypothetical protein FVQ82_02640 [Planctomycetes bacterium]|nr:hypothetical protein [Planctomycetota bacterium]
MELAYGIIIAIVFFSDLARMRYLHNKGVLIDFGGLFINPVGIIITIFITVYAFVLGIVDFGFSLLGVTGALFCCLPAVVAGLLVGGAFSSLPFTILACNIWLLIMHEKHMGIGIIGEMVFDEGTIHAQIVGISATVTSFIIPIVSFFKLFSKRN